MRKAAKFGAGLGCLISIVAPLLAALIYPRAKWLLAGVLIGAAVLILNGLFAKDPTPQALAEDIERLLSGSCGGWDVDDFEHQRIRNPKLRELWRRSIDVGGHPENWMRLSEEQKSRLREIIRKLRELGEARKQV
jgi:hypothetical protein